MKNSILSLFALLTMCSGYASEERFAEKPRCAGFPQDTGSSGRTRKIMEGNALY